VITNTVSSLLQTTVRVYTVSTIFPEQDFLCGRFGGDISVTTFLYTNN